MEAPLTIQAIVVSTTGVQSVVQVSGLVKAVGTITPTKSVTSTASQTTTATGSPSRWVTVGGTRVSVLALQVGLGVC